MFVIKNSDEIKGKVLSLFLSRIDDQCLRVFFSVDVLLLCYFNKAGVFSVRWFSAPFFLQVVFALGLLVVPSESDVSPVVKRHFRLFEQVFEAIELAILCSGYHEEDLYCISYVSFFDEIFHDF